ncbi:MAG: hypothetical protein COB85_04275 [Bacteroidetes bacterium]|nr:MAG: hypothetical protein COB85_04275 [Bacteroidota bacterium]
MNNSPFSKIILAFCFLAITSISYGQFQSIPAIVSTSTVALSNPQALTGTRFIQSKQQITTAKCLTDEITTAYINAQMAYDPAYQTLINQQNQQIQTWKQNYLNNKTFKQPVQTVPVVVHVVHNPSNSNSPNENVPDSYIFDMMTTLNEDFRRLNSDASQTRSIFVGVAADVEIEFCLASKDPSGSSTTGITRTSTSQVFFDPNTETNDMKDSGTNGITGWDATKYLNIWICNISDYANSGTAGYAYLPTPGMHGSNIDGLVIDFKLGIYYGGRTATHEIGHYMGLGHTWGSNPPSCNGDDGYGDTPNSSSKNFGCDFGDDSCPGGDVDQIENYMSYANCQNMFSTDQSNQMNSVLATTRSSLITSDGCEATAAPVANFTSDKTTVQAGAWVSFTDLSTGVPDTWEWTFGGGGTPNTTSTRNPIIQFNTIGTYDVKLKVSNIIGSDSLTNSSYITVTAPSGCDTINFDFVSSNSMYYYRAEVATPYDSGYISGTNVYDDISKAQLFTGVEYAPNSSVTGGMFGFYPAYKDGSSNAEVIFRVWDNDGTGGAPSTVLGSDTIDLADIVANSQSGYYQNVYFEPPISVSGDYYFGYTMYNFDLFGGGTADSLALLQSLNGNAASSSIPWEQWSNNTWADYPSSWTFFTTTTLMATPWMTTQAPPTASLTADTTSGCFGMTVTFDASGSTNGDIYLFDVDGDGFFDFLDTVDGMITVTYDTSGTFDVELLVIGACNGRVRLTQTAMITVNPAPSLAVTSSDATCGNCNGTAGVTATLGTSPYTYSWTNPPLSTTSSISALCPGSYQIFVEDSVGCTGIAGVNISDPASMSLSTSATNADCGLTDGTATATATGGATPYTYIWDDPGTQTIQTATGLGAGTYNVTVTDANGCVVETDFFGAAVVSASAAVTSSITGSVNPTCNGGTNGSATAAGSGGNGVFTYSWSTSPAQSNAMVTGLSAGVSYTVTVTDGIGCMDNSSITLTEPAAIVLDTSTTDASCGVADGTASVSITSGGATPFTYSWSDSNSQTNATATGLLAGPYTVTVTDGNSCTAVITAAISDAGAPGATVNGTPTTCNGGSDGTATVSASGGAPPYTYSWSTSPAQTNVTATALSAIGYTISVTDSANCTVTMSYTVTQPAAITISTTSTAVLCNGGSDGTATATPSLGTAPYTYTWNTSPVQNTATATGLSAVSYMVSVIDSNDCAANTSVTITEPGAISISTSATVASCGGSDGTATVSATGGVGTFTYVWDDGGNQSNMTATGLASGNYLVMVSDSNGCLDSASQFVGNAGAPNATTTSTDVSCSGGMDGTATVSATGGTLPYTYVWSDGGSQTNTTATGLSMGSYTVTITDASSCQTSSTVTVAEPASALTVNISTTIATTGMSDGSATVTASGGTGAYTYSWNDPGTQSNATANGLAAGVYTATITDANGCSTSATDTVVELVGINDLVNQLEFNMFPNPTNGDVTLTFQLDFPGDLKLSIFNTIGQLVTSENIMNISVYSFVLNMSAQPAGIYYVQVKTESEIFVRKLSIVR